jgi:rare lipoprotein A
MNRNVLYLIIGVLTFVTAVFGYRLYQERQKITGIECGLASVYSTVSEETASGEDTRFKNLTAAHRSLPFGTLVQVENRENGHLAVVRITDRGPFISGRIIDVSQVAARELGFSGLTQVCLNILSITESRPVGKD